MSRLSPAAQAHLERIRTFYDAAPVRLRGAADAYRRLLARHYNRLIPAGASVLEVGCGAGGLLRHIQAGSRTGVDLSAVQIEAARREVPEAEFFVQAGEALHLPGKFDCIILSDTLNLAADVQGLLTRLQAVSHPGTRLIVNYYSVLWRPLLAVLRGLGVAAPVPAASWLSTADVQNLLRLADWTPVVTQPRLLLPADIPLLSALCNRWLAPLLPALCLTDFTVARSAAHAPHGTGRVSVIIPARNEAGNIEAAVRRMPSLGTGTEIIFVEGHSTDSTWDEIQRVVHAHPDKAILALRQTGRGKGDAVRAGFAAATGDILMILDADLTMPPEELPKFHAVLASGHAEFANGVRLVYPMDEHAMPFLNLCVNKAFGMIFSWLLGQPVKDTLCGTKALSRTHYAQIAANRAFFGDFDPFGDFDLLFGAARLNLAIADVPIRYQERTYGTTNIQRWRHGWLLLRMVCFAAGKLKFV
jgi:SAM-dependent methyltransferase